jgi:His-Xaa-Ser system protein HxsD
MHRTTPTTQAGTPADPQPPAPLALSSSTATILVDETIYSRDAVLRACHWFTDRCHVFVSRAKPGVLSVRITAKPGGAELDSVVGDFENALLDAQLRREIGQETAPIRELIVAKAFAEGDLLDDAPAGEWREPVGLQDTEGNDKDGAV